ncbi:MAG: LysE family transporter [Gammaproteobacteria bacterium]|nr:LysE family transporter [Gammaproteobacteria bacterium]
MLHILIVTLLLGLGAAAPVGPINLEIIRRHLQSGFTTGIIFGSGACSADLTYLFLLSLGVLTLLTHVVLINSMGIVGSLILFWFGFSAVRLTSKLQTSVVKEKNYAAHFRDGYRHCQV